MNDAPSLRLRAALDDLPAYVPGRPAAAGSGPAYKLSSNENPYPPLPGVVQAVAEATAGINRYPELASTALVGALSARHDVPPDWFAPGTGSVGVLQSLLQVVGEPGAEVVHAWRSFEAYPIVIRLAGATAVPVPLTGPASPGGAERHDLDAMAAAVTPRTRLILLCSPNNPTGTVIGAAELGSFLDRVPEDVLVVLDEAYVEFVRDLDAPDGLGLVRERGNVAILRTFSKAYGLAGLRVGYAIARPPVAAALRKAAVPFGVNVLAQTAALASLAAEAELLQRVQALVAERERVLAAWRALGWPVVPSGGNFFWLRLGDSTAEWARAAETRGVVVRAFPGEGVRVTIGEPAANDLLLAFSAETRHATGHSGLVP